MWRLFPAGSDFLVGEDRDLEAKKIHFFCLDGISGRLLWTNRDFAANWWIGIEYACTDLLLLHEFVRPDMPDHHKLIALDLQTGKIRWTRDDLKFLTHSGGSIFAIRNSFDRQAIVELDSSTGAAIGETVDNLAASADQFRKTSDDGLEHLTFPETIDWKNIKKISDTVVRSGRIEASQIVGQLEYILRTPFTVIAYYINVAKREEVSLQQQLLIFHEESRSLVYEDIMATQIKTPAPDLFFERNGILYYIKNRNSLRALRLSFAIRHRGFK